MTLRKYTFIWLLILVVLIYEYLMLNSNPTGGLLGWLKENEPGFKDLNLSPEAGRPISLMLGWLGFGAIATTNLYVLRKRLPFLSSLGKAAGWLNFHIFCGMIGPTLIVFHTNFKVRGLVTISFWSMVIVALSGVVGRYFFMQVTKRKAEFEHEASHYEKMLGDFQKAVPGLAADAWIRVKEAALRRVGGSYLVRPAGGPPGFIPLMMVSLIGDFRLKLGSPAIATGMPAETRKVLREFALSRRRVLHYDSFRQYLGYWHAFHLPFAYFMYSVAIIHIATALLFGVKH